MSNKPKRWKGKEVYNLHNPENDPSYAGGLIDGVEANDPLIDWQEQQIAELELKETIVLSELKEIKELLK